jgi:hypothetical protein
VAFAIGSGGYTSEPMWTVNCELTASDHRKGRFSYSTISRDEILIEEVEGLGWPHGPIKFSRNILPSPPWPTKHVVDGIWGRDRNLTGPWGVTEKITLVRGEADATISLVFDRIGGGLGDQKGWAVCTLANAAPFLGIAE